MLEFIPKIVINRIFFMIFYELAFLSLFRTGYFDAEDIVMLLTLNCWFKIDDLKLVTFLVNKILFPINFVTSNRHQHRCCASTMSRLHLTNCYVCTCPHCSPSSTISKNEVRTVLSMWTVPIVRRSHCSQCSLFSRFTQSHCSVFV